MSGSLPRTLRTLERDSFHRSAWSIAVGLALLAGWTVWFLLADVAVTESSSVARLEVANATHPVASEVGGRIARTHVVLGKRVAAGEVLVELEATNLELELAEQRARVTAIEPQLAAIDNELASETQATASGGGAARAASAASKQRVAEAEAGLRLAQDELARVEQLVEKNAIAGTEAVKARAEVERRTALVEAARHDVTRLQLDERTTSSDRRVHLERLRREQARLGGEVAVGRAQVQRLEHEVKRRTLRAPIAGVLAASSPLVAGGMVRDGEVVASVIPDSRIKIVAHFSPSSAFGRLRVGQRAWMRLDGFAWTQYGALPAEVSAVAGETQHGMVRVELELLPGAPARIPQQHGLPGTVEIEVESVSPALLVLRSLGQFLGKSAESP